MQTQTTKQKQQHKTLKELEQELQAKVPSYYVVPVSSKEEEDILDKKGILGVFVILEGEFKDHLIILRDVKVKEKEILIDYSVLDKDHKDIKKPPKALDEIVGDLVNLILVRNELRYRANENNSTTNTQATN